MGYKYKVNHEYFNKINTEYKAYILGFIYADGCISQPSGNRQLNFRIGVQEEDCYILDELSKKAAGGQKNIVKTSSSVAKGYKSQHCINIVSNQIGNNLIDLGCNINKTKLGMNFPKLEKNLIPHFIRGFLDGDGSVILKKLQYKYIRKTDYKLTNPHKQQYKLKLAFCSTDKIFLLEIAKCLSIIKPYITEKVKTQVNYILWIENKQEVLNSVNYLYSDATYFLKRKYDKVVEFNMTIKSEAKDTSLERLETT